MEGWMWGLVTDTWGFLDPHTPPQLVLIMTTNKKCGNLIADETSSSLIFHFHPNFSSQVNKVVKLSTDVRTMEI